MACARCFFVQFLELSGLEQADGIGDCPRRGTANRDARLPQSDQGAWADAANENRVGLCACKGLHWTARTVNMGAIPVG